MQTNKKERASNAQFFMSRICSLPGYKAYIVIDRHSSYMQFVCSFPELDKPLVLAQSPQGIAGCWHEFLSNFYQGKQMNYYDDGFKEWVEQHFAFRIISFDGLVFAVEGIPSNFRYRELYRERDADVKIDDLVQEAEQEAAIQYQKKDIDR